MLISIFLHGSVRSGWWILWSCILLLTCGGGHLCCVYNMLRFGVAGVYVLVGGCVYGGVVAFCFVLFCIWGFLLAGWVDGLVLCCVVVFY